MFTVLFLLCNEVIPVVLQVLKLAVDIAEQPLSFDNEPFCCRDSITEGWDVPCAYRGQLYELLDSAGYEDIEFQGMLDTCGTYVSECNGACGRLEQVQRHNVSLSWS